MLATMFGALQRGTLAVAATIFTALLVGALLGPRRLQPLPPPRSEDRSRWLNLTEASSLPPEVLDHFVVHGHALLSGAVPRILVDDLLLPELAHIHSTPLWARLLLPHLRERFKAVRYGVALESRAVRDFWLFGPAARLTGLLLGGSPETSPLLLADAYYAVAATSEGLTRHTDAETSYCLVTPDTPGVSWWLALDDAPEALGGGIEVCSVAGSVNHCITYDVRRGDVILFTKNVQHRTVPWHGGEAVSGVRLLRRALVGRLVPHRALARRFSAPAALVHANGFDGPYLCSVPAPPPPATFQTDLLLHSPCTLQLSAHAAAGADALQPDVRLLSPAWPLLELMADAAATWGHSGVRLTQASALFLTLLIEMAVAALLPWPQAPFAPGARDTEAPILRARLLAASAAGSLLTHPCVWFWAEVVMPHASEKLRAGPPEVFALVAEWALLRLLLRRHAQPGSYCNGSPILGIGVAFALSLTMNAASFGFGLALGRVVRLSSGGFSTRTTAVSWALGLMLVSRLVAAP